MDLTFALLITGIELARKTFFFLGGREYEHLMVFIICLAISLFLDAITSLVPRTGKKPTHRMLLATAHTLIQLSMIIVNFSIFGFNFHTPLSVLWLITTWCFLRSFLIFYMLLLGLTMLFSKNKKSDYFWSPLYLSLSLFQSLLYSSQSRISSS